MIRKEGKLHKLTQNEIDQVIKGFDKGFNSNMSGSITPEAKIIYENIALLETISDVAYNVSIAKTKDTTYLNELISDLKQVL